MVSQIREWTRARRRTHFFRFLPPRRPLRIIDLGGTVPFWRGWGITADDRLHVTLINNHHVDKTAAGYGQPGPNIENCLMDANDVTVGLLRSFDLVFSNSFIEHLGSRSEQATLASKICESGKPYFIQVPNKSSPLDPHFPSPFAPFFAMYPRRMQAALLARFRLGSGTKSGSVEAAMERLRFYNPLGLSDVKAMFPGAKFALERPLGVPMSVLAWRDNWG
jgi:hypothetical protein